MSTKKQAVKTPVKAAKPAAKAVPRAPAPRIEVKAAAPKVEAKKPELKAVPKSEAKPLPKVDMKPTAKVELKAVPPSTAPKMIPAATLPAKITNSAAAPAKPVIAVVAKPEKKKSEFRTNDWVVYPAHGVGRIVSVVEQEVAGIKLELFVITFDKDKMTLRVPVAKASAIGMRRLSSPDVVASALQTLKGRARIKRTMWSRRAQEYEAKINSGDLISIAEVVRDLHRTSGQPEQSYSERQLYEAALARMAREVAAVERIDEDAAVKRLEVALQRAA
ncbi:MAG: CarD family transcriptional regulator [Micropepsaceae bacterium]